MSKKLGFFEMMVAEDKTSATLRLSGYVGSKYYESQLNVISAADVSKSLEALPATVKTLNVTINSRGGSVTEGVEIYELLKGFDGTVNTAVVGMAASMGSFLLCAGKERKISKSAQVMIHMPSGGGFGTAKDLRAAAESLENITEQMLDVYEETTGMDRATLESHMEQTKFYKAKDAVKLGFCTGLLAAEKEDEEDSALMSLNPEQEKLLMLDRWDAAAFADVISETNNQGGANPPSNHEEDDEDMKADFKLLGTLGKIVGAEMALQLAEKNPEAKGLGDFEEAILKQVEDQAKLLTDAQAKVTDLEEKLKTSEAQAKDLSTQVKSLGAAPVVVTMEGDPSTPAPQAQAGERPEGLAGEALAKWQFAHEPALAAEFGSESAYLAIAKDCGYPEKSDDVK